MDKACLIKVLLAFLLWHEAHDCAYGSLSVVSTNDGNGNFGWTLSAPEGSLVFDTFRMKLLGVQEIITPPGWVAGVGENDFVTWTWTGTGGSPFYGPPMVLGVRSTIATTASYDGLAGGPIAFAVFPFIGPGTSTAAAPTLQYSLQPGNVLRLSWPTNFVGWKLQAQTNAPVAGLTANWSTIANSAASNVWTLTMSPAAGSVFFRLSPP